MADCGHLQEPVKHFIVKVHWLLLLWQEGLQNPQDLSCLHPNSKISDSEIYVVRSVFLEKCLYKNTIKVLNERCTQYMNHK